MTGKKVLITGINGFLGRHLRAYLVKQNIEVFGIGRSAPVENNVFRLDLTDSRALRDLIETIRADYIFHAASVIFADHPGDYYMSNVLGTLNLLEAVTAPAGYRPRVLSIGTGAEYGFVDRDSLPVSEEYAARPYHHYGISKLAQTRVCLDYCRKFGLPLNVARLFNLLGAGMSPRLAIGTFVNQINHAGESGVIKTGNLASYRDYLDISDAVRLLWALVNSPACGQVINVCTGRPVAMHYLVEKLVALSGKRLTIKEEHSRFKERDIPVHYGANQKMLALLGYQYSFKKLEDSLRELVSPPIGHSDRPAPNVNFTGDD